MIDMVVLGCLGVVLAIQAWTLYKFQTAQDGFGDSLDLILDNAEDLERNLDSLAPILQAIIERIDGGLDLIERAPESPLAPIMQNGIAMLVQRWIDNTTNATPSSWPENPAVENPQLVDGSQV